MFTTCQALYKVFHHLILNITETIVTSILHKEAETQSKLTVQDHTANI